MLSSFLPSKRLAELPEAVIGEVSVMVWSLQTGCPLCQGNRLSRCSGILLPMDGEPDGRPVGRSPFDAMPHVRRDMHVVPPTKQSRLGFPFEKNFGRTLEDQHPFGPVLVVEVARRAGVTSRDDPFDPEIRNREQFDELFVTELHRDVGEYIAVEERHRRVLPLRRAARRVDQAAIRYASTLSLAPKPAETACTLLWAALSASAVRSPV